MSLPSQANPLTTERQQPAILSTAVTAGDNGQGMLAHSKQGRKAGTTASPVVAEPVRRKREYFPIHKVARAVLKVRRGWQVYDALAATGIPPATWYQWLKVETAWPTGDIASHDAQVFSARLRHAFARAQALAAGKATETVYSAAKKAQGEVDWRAGHEWLKHGASRARWHEHRELKIEHAGQVSHEHRMAREMTDAQLLELAPDEWRELLPPALPGDSAGD